MSVAVHRLSGTAVLLALLVAVTIITWRAFERDEMAGLDACLEEVPVVWA